MAHDVFVSHSAKDKPTADAVCAMLEAQGIRCWVAPRDIIPGKDWGESIIDAIKGARVMVLIFSTHANNSHQIKREVERAVNKGIPVIPLRIEAIEPTASLEYFLSTPHWLDAFTPPLEKHLQYLAQIIRSIIGGTLAEPASVPPEAKKKPEVAEAIKTESATRTPQPISPASSLAGKKRKSPLLAMAIVALILTCLGGWYFGVYQPEQKHQAEKRKADELVAQKAAEEKKAAQELVAKQAAEEKTKADAAAAKQAADVEAARQAEAKHQADAALAAQKAAQELAAKQAAEEKAKADAAAAKQAADAKAKADAEAKQAAEAAAAQQAADAKAKADAEAKRQAAEALAAQKVAQELAAQQEADAKAVAVKQAVSAATNNQTLPDSYPRATLTKLSLADFNEIFGLKIGAKTKEVSGLFGNPNPPYTEGGVFDDKYLVWTYPAGGTEDLKIEFNNHTMAIHSITFNEDHLPWLTARGVNDPKLSLLGRPFNDIRDLIGDPTMDNPSLKQYLGNGLEVDFYCPEYKGNKCWGITIIWSGQ